MSDEAPDLAARITAAVRASAAELAAEIKRAADDIKQASASHDAAQAIVALRSAHDRGVLTLAFTPELLDALKAIDIAALGAEDRRLVRMSIISACEILRRWSSGREAADSLLADADIALSNQDRASVELFRACAMQQAGNVETALGVFRRISRDETLLADTRARTWHNLSIALPNDSTEAREAARRSADAFLEAGSKIDAARSLGRLAQCCRADEPTAALAAINRILEILDSQSVQAMGLRGSALHESANLLLSLGRSREAFDRALKSAETRAALPGRVRQHLDSLYLAIFAGQDAGLTTEVDGLTSQVNELAQKYGDDRSAFAQRLTALAERYSSAEAATLIAEAKEKGLLDIEAAATLIRVDLDTALNDEAKTELLEEQLLRLRDLHRGPFQIENPLLVRLATFVTQAGDPARATGLLRRAHEIDPLDKDTFGRLWQDLCDTKAWPEALVTVEREIKRVGESPGLVYLHARCLYEVGELNRALPRLREAAKLNVGKPFYGFITSLIERAIEGGGTQVPTSLAASAAVSLEEVTESLRNFAAFVSAHKRMRFWSRDPTGKRIWRERPEQFGQDLLHTYLQANFSGRVQVLEEIPAGAGRIDVLLHFSGGLTVMVELKMCGGTYSSTYAASGEHQLSHYMANRDTHIGVLLVLDGRIRDYGNSVLTDPDPRMTIQELFVDLRP
jgi:hypothetical protein